MSDLQKFAEICDIDGASNFIPNIITKKTEYWLLDSYSKSLMDQFEWGQNSSSVYWIFLGCRFQCFLPQFLQSSCWQIKVSICYTRPLKSKSNITRYIKDGTTSNLVCHKWSCKLHVNEHKRLLNLIIWNLWQFLESNAFFMMMRKAYLKDKNDNTMNNLPIKLILLSSLTMKLH